MNVGPLQKFGWVFAIVALILLLALWTAPRSMYGACGMSCVPGDSDVPYPETGQDIDLSGICQVSGHDCDCCEITSVSQHVAMDGWHVEWKCCDCVGDQGLPDCEMPFGFIHQMFGLCV